MASKISLLMVEVGWAVGREALSRDRQLMLRTAESLEEAHGLVGSFRPTVIVVSLARAVPGEAEAVGRLIRAARAPALVVTPVTTADRMTRLLKAGASGYLFAADARVYLPVAVRELAEGRVPMSPAVARVVLARLRRCSSQMAAVPPATPAPASPITERQREVLALLARGHTYYDIALALALSLNTVRSHVRTIYERLGVCTKVEAVVIAGEMGLLPRGRLA